MGIPSMVFRKVMLFSGVLIAIALASAGPVSAATLGQYDRPDASLNITANRWNPNSAITFVGAHFSPNERVTLGFAGVTADVPAGADGSFSWPYHVPNVAPGNYNFTATGVSSHRYAEFKFPVQPFNAWGEPSSYWFPVGTDLKFSGHRFGRSELVDVYLDRNIVSTLHSDIDGESSNQGSFHVPASLFGKTLNFKLVGRSSRATATFTASVANWPLLSSNPLLSDKPLGGPTIVPPKLNTTTLTAQYSGQPLWQALDFTGGNFDVCDLRVTATGPPGSTISYPSGHSFSQPHKQAGLGQGMNDFVAINVVPPSSVTTNQSVVVHVAYTSCLAPSTVKHFNKSLTLPITVGAPFKQLTTDVGDITAGASQWLSTYYEGFDGNNTDFKVTVTDSPGATITYPSGRAFTSLQGDSTLSFGETDFVAIHIDTAGLTPGVYVLSLSATAGPHAQSPSLAFHVV